MLSYPKIHTCGCGFVLLYWPLQDDMGQAAQLSALAYLSDFDLRHVVLKGCQVTVLHHSCYNAFTDDAEHGSGCACMPQCSLDLALPLLMYSAPQCEQCILLTSTGCMHQHMIHYADCADNLGCAQITLHVCSLKYFVWFADGIKGSESICRTCRSCQVRRV